MNGLHRTRDGKLSPRTVIAMAMELYSTQRHQAFEDSFDIDENGRSKAYCKFDPFIKNVSPRSRRKYYKPHPDFDQAKYRKEYRQMVMEQQIMDLGDLEAAPEEVHRVKNRKANAERKENQRNFKMLKPKDLPPSEKEFHEDLRSEAESFDPYTNLAMAITSLFVL